MNLPNPFCSSAAGDAAAETAVASPVTIPGTVDAAATTYAADHRFVLDERAFMEAIEPLPLFLQAPVDVLNVLAGYA